MVAATSCSHADMGKLIRRFTRAAAALATPAAMYRASVVYCSSWTQANPPQDAHLYRRKLLPLRVSSMEMAAADPLHWEQVRKGGSIRCAFFPAFSSSLMTRPPTGILLGKITDSRSPCWQK